MKVLKIVNEDISDKIDTQFAWDQLQHIENVILIYMCTRDEQHEDDWIDEDGHYVVIVLPYKEVKRLEDVRMLMLNMAKERLRLAA